MKEKILGSRYQVLEDIAKGGFGQTYLAVDTQLPGKDLCVVKKLSSTIEDPKILPVARRLFKAEASALHNLGHHAQIPELLAYFEEAENFYLVQQYIAGQTLEQELNSTAIWSESATIQLLTDSLQILDFIHAHGVIHRDIKPANLIRRQSDRQLVLVDFGSVKNILQGQSNLGQLTIPVGTQGYMPTEQARGKPGATSDLYALGIMAIQALTKVEPLELEEDEHGELLWSHLVQISPQLAKILTTMTRYQVKDRYQSAAEALQALNSLSQDDVTESQPAGDRSWSDDAVEQTVLTTTVRKKSDHNLATQMVAADANELDLSRHNHEPMTVNPRVIVREMALSSELQPQQHQTSKVNSIVGWALSIGIVIVGSVYWLLMQPTGSAPQLESSPPNSETPRLDQGDGFRDDL